MGELQQAQPKPTATMKKAKSEPSLTQRTTRNTKPRPRFANSRALSRDLEHTTQDDPESPITPSQSASNVPPVVESHPESFQLAAANSILSEFTTGPHPSPITESFQLEDFSKYMAAIRDPARSSASLGIAICEVRAILEREQALLKILQKKISSRAKLLNELKLQLDTEALLVMQAERSVSGTGTSSRRVSRRVANREDGA